MSEFKYRRPQINVTTELPHQNAYTLALNGEYKHVAFDEVRAPHNKGQWRKNVFNVSDSTPLDLEIGPGTGIHYAFQAERSPERCFFAIELKYKPLIQTIRRALKAGCKNVAVARFHAFNLDQLFEPQELNNIYIHFPDPWTSPLKPKNRVVNHVLLDWMFDLQRPGSFIEFKTDSREYFLWALEEIKLSKYKIEFQTLNLYGQPSPYLESNYPTTFEKIFVKQGIEINYIRLVR